jgi:hypothetical protein
MISDKSSVPKEMVYPKFESVGSLWINIWEEFTLLKARYTTMQVLTKFRLSFQPTLSEESYVVNVLSDNLNAYEAMTDEIASNSVVESKIDTKMSIIDRFFLNFISFFFFKL